MISLLLYYFVAVSGSDCKNYVSRTFSVENYALAESYAQEVNNLPNCEATLEPVYAWE